MTTNEDKYVVSHVLAPHQYIQFLSDYNNLILAKDQKS